MRCGWKWDGGLVHLLMNICMYVITYVFLNEEWCTCKLSLIRLAKSSAI